jgi:mRNA-degrading endonuclease RelE of RelBE toxin-antitoxin system
LPEQDFVEGSRKKYSELQSARVVFAEEHEKVVRELKELQSHHQDDLKKIKQRHLAELQTLQDTKSKLLKEKKGTLLSFVASFYRVIVVIMEVVV